MTIDLPLFFMCSVWRSTGNVNFEFCTESWSIGSDH